MLHRFVHFEHVCEGDGSVRADLICNGNVEHAEDQFLEGDVLTERLCQGLAAEAADLAAVHLQSGEVGVSLEQL